MAAAERAAGEAQQSDAGRLSLLMYDEVVAVEEAEAEEAEEAEEEEGVAKGEGEVTEGEAKEVRCLQVTQEAMRFRGGH